MDGVADPPASDNLLRVALVRILDQESHAVGFGLLVAEGKVVTCAHVAAQSLGEDSRLAEKPTRRRVRLDFPFLAPGRILTAAVVAWQPMAQDGAGDVAGLELDDNVPETARPIPLARGGNLDGHEIQAYGYQTPGHTAAPTWVPGVIVSRTEQGWLQLGLSQATGGLRIRQGFSGSPVWNRQTGQVVGLVSKVHPHKNVWLSYAISGDLILNAWPDLQAWESCPYRPFTPFTSSDRNIFFGRDALAAEAVDRVLTSNFSLITGASGDGKTSLIQAGITPILAERGCPAIVIRPLSRDTLWETLAATLAASEWHGDPVARERELREFFGTGSTQSRVAKMVSVLGAERMTVIVDQCEDLVHDGTQRAHDFLAALREIPSVRHPAGGPLARVVAVIRSDLEDALRTVPGLAGTIDGRIDVSPLTAGQLRSAIAGPLAATGSVRLEDRLIDRIIDDVQVQPYCLPTLQVVLADLWNRRKADGLLRHRDYQELNRNGRALTAHLERVWREHLTDDERASARRLFLHLVAPVEGGGFTRRPVRRDEVDTAEWEVAGILANNRLVVLDDGYADGPTVEVTHDALISQWPTLATQVATDRDFIIWRDDLRRRMSNWHVDGREPGHLLRRAELTRSLNIIRGRPAEISRIEREFILASQRRQNRIRRRTWSGAVAGTVAVIVAATATLVALQQHRQAIDQQRIAAAHGLVAQADTLRDRDPRIALRLGIAAQHIHNDERTQAGLFNTLTTNRAVAATLGHTENVWSVAWSPDGHTLATGGADSSVILWDVSDLDRAHRIGNPLTGHTNVVRSVVWSPDGHTLATSSGADSVILWDLTDRDQPRRIGNPLTGQLPAWSPDGQTLATSSEGDTVILWDLTDRNQPRRIGNPLTGYAPTWSPDGHTLFTIGGDEPPVTGDDVVIVWDVTDRTRPHRISDFPPIGSMVWSPDGATLATTSSEHSLTLWDISDRTRPQRVGDPLTGHTDLVNSVAWSADSRTLASASNDGTVILWDVTDRDHPRRINDPLTGHTLFVESVSWSPDGHTLASASLDHTVIVWDISDRTRPQRIGDPLTGHTDEVLSVAWSPDGDTLATASFDHTAILWDFTDRQRPRRIGAPLTGHTGLATSLVWSPDGNALATASLDHTVILWDVTDRTRPRRIGDPLTGHTDEVSSVAWSPDGDTLATASFDHTAILWDVSDRTQPRRIGDPLTGHKSPLGEVDWSPDGHTLATAHSDHSGTVILWDVSDRTRPRRIGDPLTGHKSPLGEVDWSPDGHTLATASWDQAVVVWDLIDRNRPRRVGGPLAAHEFGVRSADWSPDSRTLATGGSDRRVILWEFTDRDRPYRIGSPLTGYTGAVNSVAWSPDGSTLATAGDDHTVTVWDLTGLTTLRGQAMVRACTAAGGGLTEEQWRRYVPILPYQHTCH